MEDTLEREVNVRYERDNSINYAVIDAQEEWNCEDDYEVKMLMFNMPEHFLAITMNEIDGRNCIYYDISSKQQLSKLFEYGKVTMEEVKIMFNNISEMVRVVDEYMLDLDRVILKPQHIYVSLANKKYSFMYSPIAGNSDFYDNMRSLFEYILERFDHSVEKSSLVRFYEIYQRILVRDYTPRNLMSFFENDDNTQIDIEDDDNEHVGKTYHDAVQTWNGEINRMKSESEAVDHVKDGIVKDYNRKDGIVKDYNCKDSTVKDYNRKDGRVKDRNRKERTIKDITCKTDENSQHNGKIIKDVLPETAEDNKSNKSSKKAVFVMKAVAAVILLNAFLSMFLKTYAVVKLNTAASVICIIAGILIFYVSGKVADIIGEIASEDKVTEDELIPYRMHNNTDKSYERKPEAEHEYMEDAEKTSYSSMVTARVMKDEEEQEIKVSHTMLLSDYLKMLKDNKLTLSLLDNKDNRLYMKNEEAYEQTLENIEPVKYPCTIGSLEGSADIFIDSPVISKMHACLLKEDDKFYIEDMNSTNGTYINDERIAMHSKTRIADGDILRVAAYNFKVCIS